MSISKPDRQRLEAVVSSALSAVCLKKFATRGDVLELVEQLEKLIGKFKMTGEPNSPPFSEIIAQSPEEVNLDDPHFEGDSYSRKHDQKRLTASIFRVFGFMNDGEWHTNAEIAAGAGVPENSATSLYRQLRLTRWGSNAVLRRNRGDRSVGLYEYKLVPNVESMTWRMYVEDSLTKPIHETPPPDHRALPPAGAA